MAKKKKIKKEKRKEKINELHKKYKGKLTEYIYNWFNQLTQEEENEIFWNNNKTKIIEKQMKKDHSELKPKK